VEDAVIEAERRAEERQSSKNKGGIDWMSVSTSALKTMLFPGFSEVQLAKNAKQNRGAALAARVGMKTLVPDGLWSIVEPLLPPEPPKPKSGRQRRRSIGAVSSTSGLIFWCGRRGAGRQKTEGMYANSSLSG
jgi:hypothetical protein